MTVADLLERMSAQEISEWVAYYKLRAWEASSGVSASSAYIEPQPQMLGQGG